MRVIVVEIHDESDADDAFSIIEQSLNDADIAARVTLIGEFKDQNDDGGAS